MNVTTATYRSDHTRGTLDIITPGGTGPFPIVVIIHGGGWSEGSKEEAHKHARMLLPYGLASVMPNYRLTTTHPHPAQQDDILSVLDWIASQAASFGGDIERVGLTGWSAGGHLAAQVGLLATRRNVHHPCRIRCIHPVCGVFDLPLWLQDCPQYASQIHGLAGGPTLSPLLSPITLIHPDAPPFRLTHGTADLIVPPNQSERMYDALTKASVPASCHLIPGEHHTSLRTDRPEEPLGGIEGFIRFFHDHLLA